MTLMDELAAEATVAHRGPACGVARYLNALPESERPWFQKALDTPTYESTWLTKTKAFAERGIVLKPNAIQRHRRGDCQCSKTS